MSTPPPARHVGFWEALRFWFKLGLVSFGGPAGQIAIMHRELGWSNGAGYRKRAFCMPSTTACCCPDPRRSSWQPIGWLMHRTLRWRGSGRLVCAALTGAAGGPEAGSMWCLARYRGWWRFWRRQTRGGSPGPAGGAPYRQPNIEESAISPRVMGNCSYEFYSNLRIRTAFSRDRGGGCCRRGVAVRWVPTQFASALAGHAAAPADPEGPGSWLLDDDTPMPAHARFTRARLARVLVAGARCCG